MGLVSGALISLLAEFLGSLGAVILAQRLRNLRRKGQGLVEPDQSALTYLDAFLATPRAPRWDPRILSLQRIGRAQVRIGERIVESDLEQAEEVAEDAPPRKVRTLSVADFLDRVLFESGVGTQRGARHPNYGNVFVILGRPASGKSMLVLQVAQLLADRARSDRTLPIPVYVNLTHFDNRYSLTAAGLQELLVRSIRNGCPRYLPVEESRTANVLNGNIPKEPTRPMDDIKILYIFDGIDEMPVVDELGAEQNRRIAAVADFIQGHPQHIFLVTCRIRDYLQLRDYSKNYQMAKLELLPWNRKMFNKYLEVRREENEPGLAQIRDTLSHAYGSDLWGQFSESPLLGALLFGGAGLKQPRTISQAWENFVETFLRAELETEGQYRTVLDALGRFAFARTLKPGERFRMERDLLASAYASGLLVPACPNPEFVIKPLQQYFAAQHLWQSIARAGREMDSLEITHPKLRVAFLMAAEIADQVPALTGYLVRQLRQKGEPFVHAERFELFSACLRPRHLEADADLQTGMVDVLELVIDKGDAGDFDLCMKGIENLPEVLLVNRIRTLDFMIGILLSGTREAKRRLFQLMVCKPILALRYPRVLVRLLLLFVNRGQFGLELCHLVQKMCHRAFGCSLLSSFLTMLVRVVRFAAIAAYIYGAYMIGLGVAHYGIRTTAGLLNLQWASSLELPILPASVMDWAARLGFLAVATAIPWAVVTRMARAQYRFRSVFSRIGALLGTGSFVRYVLLIPFLGVVVLNTMSSALEYAIVVLLLVMPLAVTAMAVYSWRQTAAQARLHTTGPTAISSGDGSGGRNAGVASVPPELAELIRRFHLETEASEERDTAPYLPRRGFVDLFTSLAWLFRDEVRSALGRRRVRRKIALACVLTMATLLLATYHLEKLALLLVGLTAMSWVLKRFLYDPWREYVSLSKILRSQSLDGLGIDFEYTVNRILGQIANGKLLVIFRKKYVHILDTYVRWDAELLRRFRSVCAQEGVPWELRRYMQAVVVKKRREIQQNTNPKWDPLMTSELFKRK